MADGDLSGEADQDVEADTDDGGQRDQRQHERRVALAVEARRRARSEGEDASGLTERRPSPHRHTF